MSKIWIAVDGGGTKTEFCACDENSNIIFNDVFGNANYKASSKEDVYYNLSLGFNSLFESTDTMMSDVCAMVVGVAGCDSEEDRKVYLNILKNLNVDTSKVYLCNDTELIFRALSDKDGICAVAGTGSIACAYNTNGLLTRCGGWGAPISDLGSGYWIGEIILKKLIRFLDGQEQEELPLYKDILNEFVNDKNNAQCELVGLEICEVASIAYSVISYANSGNETCREIVDKSSSYLSDIICTTFKKSGFNSQIDIVLTGGLFKDDNYFESVQKKVLNELKTDYIKFIRPQSSPAIDGLRFVRKKLVS